MLNIEQELELSNPAYEVRSVREGRYDERETIIAEVYRNGRHYDTWSFDKKTGVMIGHENADEPQRLRPKSETRAIDHFYIHAGYRDWSKDGWVKLAHEHFHNGGEASERMKQHNALASTALSPFRFTVKKEVELSPVRDYSAWAEFRFGSGEWEPVPWANEDWAQTEDTKCHYAHIAKGDDSLVAFWDGEYEACRDSITTLAPGKYLQRFFGHALNNEQIRDWAVKVDAEAELRFAHTADEMHDVYTAEGGPSSCMRYPDHTTCHDGVIWRSGINPIRAYAAGDLAVAYITRKGKIAGRAIVWPEKKIAGRRYGDIERLEAALKEAGYTMDSAGSGASSRARGGFNGARLLKIEPEDHEDNFVMPYLDYGYRFNIGDEFLTLNMEGAHFGTRTDGLAYEPAEEADEEDTFTCERCGDDDPLDDENCFNGYSYCGPCLDHVSRDCDRCDNRVSRDSITVVNDDDYWCRTCVENHCTTCDYCSELYDRDNIVPVHDARYEPGEEPDVFNDACISCRDNDAEDIQQDVNGVWIDVDTATHCDTCHNYFSGNLEEEECPNTTCVERRAEEAAAEATETENA